MKQNYLIFYLFITVTLFSCVGSEDLIEPAIQEVSSTVKAGGPELGNLAVMTVRYKPGLDEDTKEIVRKGNYIFTIDEIEPTVCPDVELWNVTLPEDYSIPGTQNGYTEGNVDTSKETTDPMDYVERIELNWDGRCTEF